MATSKGIKAGRAYVELGADDSPLSRALDRALARVRAFGRQLQAIGLGGMAIGTAALGGLLAMAKSAASAGDDLANLSARTGLTVEAIGSLTRSAQNAGASVENVEQGLAKLSRTIVEAEAGSKSAADSLAQYGLSAKHLATLSPEARIEAVADALSRISDPARRTALAYDLLGKSGTSLIPILVDGAAGLRAQREEYEQLGLAIGDAAVARVAGFDDLFADVVRQIAAFRNVVGAAAADVFEPIVKSVRPALAWVIRFVDENRGLVRWVVAGAAGLVALGSSLLSVGTTLRLAAMAASGFGAALSLVVRPLTLLTSVAGAAVGAIMTIGSVIGAAVGAVLTVGSVIMGVVATTVSAVTGIAGALVTATGLLPALLIGLVAVGGVAAAIVLNFDAIRSTAVSALSSVGTALAGAGRTVAGVFQTISDVAGKMISKVIEAFSDVKAIVGDAIGGISDALAAGNLELAAEIGITGFRAAWQRGVLFMKQTWYSAMPVIVNATLNGAARMVSGVGRAVIAIREFWIQTVFGMRMAWFVMLDQVVGRLADGVKAIFNGLATFAAKMKETLGISIVDPFALELAGEFAREKIKSGLAPDGSDILGDAIKGAFGTQNLQESIDGYVAAIESLRERLNQGLDGKESLAKTEEELRRLREQLEALKRRAAESGGDTTPREPPPGLKEMEKMFKAMGTFSGFNVAAMFAGGGQASDAKATRKAAEKTNEILARIEHKRGPVFT